MGFFFYSGRVIFDSPLVFSSSPLWRLRWWILCSSSSKTQGEAPEIRPMEEREGWVRAGGNCQEEMLCRSMKNCTGILPPQLTVWEADLISGESIWLELWEITLPKITSVTAVGTLSSQGDRYHEIITLPTLDLSRFFKETSIKQRL